MIWDTSDRAKIFVVDADRTNYENLLVVSQDRNTEVVFFASGGDALRATPENGPAIWIVNLNLPDMTGADFRTMVRNRGNCAPLALIGNEYRVEDEIAARCAGADMYFAKSMVHEILMATV